MSIWVDAPGHPNYQVSDVGEIRHKKNKRILKSSPDRYGYLRLSLGNADNIPIHRVVCKAFHGEPEGDRNQVNHIDCDRQNNRADNLEWCTASENIQWAVEHGRLDPSVACDKAREVNRRPVRIVETGEIFDSVTECAEHIGVPLTNVCRVITGSRKGQALRGYHIEHV